VNCPSCGAPIVLKPDTEGFKCDYCHAVFYPGEQDDGVQVSSASSDSTLACPICSQVLVKAAIAEIPVLLCSQCHGLLLPMPVLQPVLEELRADPRLQAVQTPPDHGDLKRTVQCPSCHRRMETHFYSGPGNVIVDSCDACSLVWFDRGELTRIARAPEGGGTEEPNWA
jgi:Zn-finger nucleic acid-binding protein